jgi:hypothetical protein
MKDATGELSMTAVAVVAIAAIGVVFTTLIWPAIRTNILRSTYCSQTVRCDDPAEGSTNGMVTCYYCPETDFDASEGSTGCAEGDLKPIQCSAKQSGGGE